MDLICHELLEFYDEPARKMRKTGFDTSESLPITSKDMEVFFILLENPKIRAFLDYDKQFQYADKYLIAMVMTYFKRASLSYEEYNPYNFYVALHLAHDMEEDEEELKINFIRWALGTKWESKHNDLLLERDRLWMSMNYRAVVSRKCCEEVISMLPEHPVWKRERSEDYGGAKRESDNKYCVVCPDKKCFFKTCLEKDANKSIAKLNERMSSDDDKKTTLLIGQLNSCLKYSWDNMNIEY